MATSQDAVAIVELAGLEYQARDFRYAANVMQLADRLTVSLAAPDGKVQTTSGYKADLMRVAQMGDAVRLWVSDPEVHGGRRIARMVGRVVGRRIRTSSQNGTTVDVTCSDYGWHLTSCAPVHKSIRGLTWQQFVGRLLGLTFDPVTGLVTADANGWGFVGVGGSNVYNRKIRLGRQQADLDYQQRAAPHTQLILPRIQCEVGQTLDALVVQYARLAGHLVNVSSDGWLQIFRPAWDGSSLGADGLPKPYTAPVQFTFRHPGNILKDTLQLEESADALYTHVECWNNVIDQTNVDRSVDQNAGTYHGSYNPGVGERPFSFERRYTFSDPEQYGSDPVTHTSRVDARAKWQWQRFAFDAQKITFEAQGHSQDGVPYVEDTMASFKSDVLGLDGVYYIASVEPYRRLARPGFDPTAGSRTKITLYRAGLLGA